MLPAVHGKTRWWGLALALVFLIHASSYLYFFVDDEGITLVYARSLLEGRGLTYAASEGPVEGYSNFLHVLIMAGLLKIVGLIGLHQIWTFVAGGLYALACGTALVVLLWRFGSRVGLSSLSATVAALLLALAGPLAVWSNSSLETVPFALAFLLLIMTTLPDIRRPWLTALAAIVVLLMRVDGLLFVGVWLGARFVLGEAAPRRQIVYRILPAVVAACGLYMLWRYWQFGAWLPLPLQTKVAHKLVGSDAAVVRRNPAGYLLPFLRDAGLPMALGLLSMAAAWFWRNGRRAAVWASGLAVTVLFTYIGVVGDWMFGFRFVVPLLAPLALLCGYSLGVIERHRPRLAQAVAIAAIGWAVVSAVRFHDGYEISQRKPSFWAAPSLDPARRFGEYYEALQAVAPLVQPGMRIAYHEAGFVPFMLGEVENLDMLGLTSRFVAGVPAQDAIFTDVGRYYPLSPEPAHHAVHAYLVSREPAIIVVRKSWMVTANHGRVPDIVLGGYYRFATETDTFVIYRRSDRPIDPRRVRADGFLENLAHPAYAERVAINSTPVPVATAAIRLPSLWQGRGHEVIANPAWTLHVDPAPDAPVHELYLEGRPPSADLHVEVVLTATEGGVSQRFDAVLPAGAPWIFRRRLESRDAAESIDIRFRSVSGDPVRFHLDAVRVMGQTETLRAHVLRHGVPD